MVDLIMSYEGQVGAVLRLARKVNCPNFLVRELTLKDLRQAR